ncbi:hypothetical protein F4778DRAFT_518212 [Xylariomycetidae sp. FL2044]|nr:hypothetical protein F4778DRAFT_518212 [Xylariomycetidae sp. FL2044]
MAIMKSGISRILDHGVVLASVINPPSPATTMREPTLNGSVTDSECEDPAGVLVGGKFILGEFIREVSHAKVFAVTPVDHSADSNGGPNIASTLEARLYDLQNLSPKLRRYRLRSVKRLSTRQVLKEEWRGKEIIVYKTGVIEGSKESGRGGVDATSLSGSESLAGDDKVVPTIKPKSNYRRESHRLRQRDRRRAKRRTHEDVGKRFMRTPLDLPAIHLGMNAHIYDDDDTLNVLVVLYNAYNWRHIILHETPSSLVWQYLTKQDEVPTIRSIDELDEFQKIKEKELVRLRRTGARLPGIVEEYYSHPAQLLEQQRQIQDLVELRWFRDGPRKASKTWSSLFRSVRSILPELVEHRKRVLSLIKSTRTLAPVWEPFPFLIHPTYSTQLTGLIYPPISL